MVHNHDFMCCASFCDPVIEVYCLLVVTIDKISHDKINSPSIKLIKCVFKLSVEGHCKCPHAYLNPFLLRISNKCVHVDGRNYLSLIHISEPTRLGMISYAFFC